MEKIKPSDLRIGNILRERQTGYPLVVCGITNDSITFDFNTNKNWQAEYVPLTEEILFKCNATLHGIEYIIKASALPFKFRFNSGIAYCEMGNVYLGDRIQYLHQLQNLFYCLCGFELDVNL